MVYSYLYEYIWNIPETYFSEEKTFVIYLMNLLQQPRFKMLLYVMCWSARILCRSISMEIKFADG